VTATSFVTPFSVGGLNIASVAVAASVSCRHYRSSSYLGSERLAGNWCVLWEFMHVEERVFFNEQLDSSASFESFCYLSSDPTDHG
jgi:hypothetical protein